MTSLFRPKGVCDEHHDVDPRKSGRFHGNSIASADDHDSRRMVHSLGVCYQTTESIGRWVRSLAAKLQAMAIQVGVDESALTEPLPDFTITEHDHSGTLEYHRPARHNRVEQCWRQEDHWVTTRDGVRLAARDCGSRHADRTVVFLHGLCLSQVSWTRQIEHLLRWYTGEVRLISYDHRGHGRSGQAPMGSYCIEQLADDLAHVLTTLAVSGSLTLVGHSMGGMAALCYLARPVAERPVDCCAVCLT
ncbi:alpha/beta fold hydrolase [Mycobacterium paraintracellulare]|uniref:alpha/beta fold hydrolase n=1 Tax=Mycobacterium paraintracellulare TaxID=1138383 RepID=UPI001F1C1AB2|nr:alpha/beta hydrolase [Mycobacterium paraintracellulare]